MDYISEIVLEWKIKDEKLKKCIKKSYLSNINFTEISEKTNIVWEITNILEINDRNDKCVVTLSKFVRRCMLDDRCHCNERLRNVRIELELLDDTSNHIKIIWRSFQNESIQ